MFAGLDGGMLADDTVAFDRDDFAVVIGDDPFSGLDRDGEVGVVMDADEIDEAMGAVRGRVDLGLVNNFVDRDLEILRFEKIGGAHRATVRIRVAGGELFLEKRVKSGWRFEGAIQSGAVYIQAT